MARLLTFMVKLPQLRVILLGLFAGLRAVKAILFVLLLLMFVFAIAGCTLFGANDPGARVSRPISRRSFRTLTEAAPAPRTCPPLWRRSLRRLFRRIGTARTGAAVVLNRVLIVSLSFSLCLSVPDAHIPNATSSWCHDDDLTNVALFATMRQR